ncbi:espin-like protein [Betta splendens]|uniref:Espin-like protein n=1 Tax=Betta splendens TaxID=158456 RepID=A0A6P7L4Q3_BETSP|nr:espin-like protein [Betta splendens]
MEVSMENTKPVKEVLPLPRHPASYPMDPAVTSTKATIGSIQHIQVASSVVASLNHLKPPQRDLTLMSRMKSVKSLRHAGFSAVFTGQVKPDSEKVLEEAPPADVIVADIDSLVPTHDEAGRPIAEWKRQVMVRQLQSRLQDEEELRGQDISRDCVSVDGWKYSQTHDAVLGPFGELLTEHDLIYLQQQIEAVSLQKRCQAYEQELTRLTDELRAILPDPIVNISLNKEILQQMNADGATHAALPVLCGRVSDLVKGLSLLVANLSRTTPEEGTEKNVNGSRGVKDSSRSDLRQRPSQRGRGSMPATSSGCRVPHIGMESAFSYHLETNSYSAMQRERVQREIQQSGVSVRELRNNFEGQIGAIYPFAGVVTGGQGAKASPREKNDHKPKPVVETTSLRKERIVLLFLSHWKRSAYAISLRAAKRTRGEEAEPGRAAAAPQPRISSMFQFCQQRGAVDKILSSWKHKLDVSNGLNRASKRLPLSDSQRPPSRVIFSPEQFLPEVDGVAVRYDDLSLDLFMLGYFHILEEELSPEERKMRHLLCFEVFDHVGTFPWETVRDFHKAVLQEIQAGRRQWGDGFEDVKMSFFGESGLCHRPSSSSSPKGVPVAQAASQEQSSRDADFSCFNNQDICKYIDRSFAFWKEKEAELFDFGQRSPT